MTRTRHRTLVTALSLAGVAALACSKHDESTAQSKSADGKTATSKLNAAGAGAAATTCEGCTAALCSIAVKARDTQCTGGKCDALRSCISSSKCDKKAPDPYAKRPGIDVRGCYCGGDVKDGEFGPCFQSNGKGDNAPHGECKAEIEKLSGSTDPIQVGLNFFNMSTALGAVAQTESCQNTACYSLCF